MKFENYTVNAERFKMPV